MKAVKALALRVLVSWCLGASLSACMALVPDDMAVIGFHDVKDVPGFWQREMEGSVKKEGYDVGSVPEEFKRCAGEEMAKMSPPALNDAVQRFLMKQNAGNYKALMPMVRKFANGYEEAYGMKPGVRAGQICQEKLISSPS